MITREFSTVLSAWHGITRELSYGEGPFLRWGLCLGYPDILEVTIYDLLKDEKLHLEMSSYTKSRWTRFLRRYFRPDLPDWIHTSLKKLQKYPNRPFVASYDITKNPEAKIIGVGAHGGHNYGGCLSSLQIRIKPVPTVILISRACQVSKIGFLDLTLMHLVAKEMGFTRVVGQWVISLPFISAVDMIFYLPKFKQPLKDHNLHRRIIGLQKRDNGEEVYGPLKRLFKRNKQLASIGHIPGAVPVSSLSLNFEEKRRKLSP